MAKYHTGHRIHDPALPACFKGVALPKETRFVEKCDDLAPGDPGWAEDDEQAALKAQIFDDVAVFGTWIYCGSGGLHFLVGVEPENVVGAYLRRIVTNQAERTLV